MPADFERNFMGDPIGPCPHCGFPQANLSRPCPAYVPSEPSRSALKSTQSEGVGDSSTDKLEGPQISDPVNHPSHYQQYPIEVIEITERLNFLLGNVVKYVLRADYKGKPLEDLKKAAWYLHREIANRESGVSA